MEKREIKKTSGESITLEVPKDYTELVDNFTQEAIYKLWLTCFTWKVQGKLGEKGGAQGVRDWYKGLRIPNLEAEVDAMDDATAAKLLAALQARLAKTN